MSLTVADIISKVNTHIDDSTNDRISESQRLSAITDATIWLQEELGNDHQVDTYTIEYSPASHYYRLDSVTPDLLNVCDLQAELGDQVVPFTFKPAHELKTEIANGYAGNAYALERKNGKSYLLINYNSKEPSRTISGLDSTTDGGGTWQVDDDATNITVDSNEYKEGTGSLNFDVDVSASGNDRATIFNDSLTQLDLGDDEDLTSWFLHVYIPDTATTSSVTLRWGSGASNYWSVTQTTTVLGESIADGWNRFKFDWEDATETGTPDATAVDYVSISVNYTGSQVDDTDYRIDGLVLAGTEELELQFTSFYVGQDSGGTDLYEYAATTDVPFYSGQYDHYKIPIAHKAAADLFRSPLRLRQDAEDHDVLAQQAVNRIDLLVPSHRRTETRSFKPGGINLNK